MQDELGPPQARYGLLNQESKGGNSEELSSFGTPDGNSKPTLRSRMSKENLDEEDYHTHQRQSRIDRVLKGQDLREDIAEGNDEDRDITNDHVNIMKFLFRYLHIDPDGGIMNLEAGEQFSKLHVLLKRETVRDVLSVILILRMGVNVPHIFHTSTIVLYCFFTETCSMYAQKSMVDSCILPLEIMAFAVAAFEFVRGTVLLSNVFIGMFRFMCASDEEDSRSKVGTPKHSYYFLSQLLFETMPNLRDFSALQSLGFVHPGVIAHYAKELNEGNAAARAVFERMLGSKADEIGDDDITDAVIQVIILKEKEDPNNPVHKEDVFNGSNGSTSRPLAEERILRYSLLSPYALFKTLREFHGPLPTHPMIADKDAMSSHGWKVILVSITEAFSFSGCCLFFFFFGCTAFVVKLARVCLVLFDPESSLTWVLFDLLAFLNQVIGMVAVQRLLRDRIFRFLFGGQDATISIDERTLKLAYEALLAEKIWTATGYSKMQKCLSLLTLSDDDIQRLVLEESHRDKRLVSSAVRMYQSEGKDAASYWNYCSECVCRSIRGTS